MDFFDHTQSIYDQEITVSKCCRLILVIIMICKLFRAKLQLSEDVLDIISNSLNNKLCVSYSSCTVYPVKPHRRCRKCQVHGHTKSQCTQNKPTCAYCAGDHFTDQCPVSDQEDKKKCINCYKSTKYKDVCNHTADSHDCPVFLDYRKDINNTAECT